MEATSLASPWIPLPESLSHLTQCSLQHDGQTRTVPIRIIPKGKGSKCNSPEDIQDIHVMLESSRSYYNDVFSLLSAIPAAIPHPQILAHCVTTGIQ